MSAFYIVCVQYFVVLCGLWF